MSDNDQYTRSIRPLFLLILKFVKPVDWLQDREIRGFLSCTYLFVRQKRINEITLLCLCHTVQWRLRIVN